MKKLTLIALASALLALALALAGCSGGNAAPSSQKSASGDFTKGVHHATVQVKGYDSFVIELDADQAPLTVDNFCKLSNDGFYDGLTFHRIVNEFCLQGGDPKGNGTGSASQTIKGEFLANSVQNALSGNFKRGVVAMARSRANDSASCQFFVTLSDKAAASLDGQYAAFGTIDEAGMAVVDKIVADYLPNASGSSGTISAKDKQPVIEKITITD